MSPRRDHSAQYEMSGGLFAPTLRVDEAILGVYLAGGNTRRIKGALAPLRRRGSAKSSRKTTAG